MNGGGVEQFDACVLLAHQHDDLGTSFDDTPGTRRGQVVDDAQENIDVLVGVLLLMVMLVGGYFRFAGLNWDDLPSNAPSQGGCGR